MKMGDTITNAYDIKIRKMCASCQHKWIEKDGTRVCMLMLMKVEKEFCCQHWQMGDGLKKAGKNK
jgi:hypothetical protein